MASVYDFEVETITGERVSLAAYRDRTLLIVNVASRCGLTPQYAGLRTLHDEHKDKGFAVLAFPCNQFGAQEPGTNAEILEFATSKYGVTFPMFAKIDVNGDGASPLYEFLRKAAPGPEGKTEISWNFAKFLVGKDGHVVRRYAPKVTPEEIGPDLLS